MISNVEHMLEDFFTEIFVKVADVVNLCLQVIE